MDIVCNWDDDADDDDDEEELADIKIGLSELVIIIDSPFYLDDYDGIEGTATHSWYYPALDISLGSTGLILIATLIFPFYFYFIYIRYIYTFTTK